MGHVISYLIRGVAITNITIEMSNQKEKIEVWIDAVYKTAAVHVDV